MAPAGTRYAAPFAEAASLRAAMRSELPAGLADHIDRVVALAESLARRHGLDLARTLLAAQAHDLLRAVPTAELLRRAAAASLDIDAVERAAPVLLHGPLGAHELAARGWLADPLVLDAVRWHTTGHPAYSPEAWAVFVADKVDPHKIDRWPALAAVAELALGSLELAALAYLELNAARARREGWAPHPLAERTRLALRQRLA
ncbi:MAG: HD domain-containing protein [Dehalococcoidia bacterium]|nr:HD domain-containing protein [Dehalococcoidia bacterium]